MSARSIFQFMAMTAAFIVLTVAFPIPGGAAKVVLVRGTTNAVQMRGAPNVANKPWYPFLNSPNAAQLRTARLLRPLAGGAWHILQGSASSVGAGAGFDPVVVGTQTYGAPGNSHIYAWSGSPQGGSFSTVLGGWADQVSVGSTSTPWVVNTFNQIFRYTSINSTVQLPGGAFQVSAIDSLTCYVVGTAAVGPAGNYAIFYWDGSAFSQVPGFYGVVVSQMASPLQGYLWSVTANGTLYERYPSGQLQAIGTARDVANTTQSGVIGTYAIGTTPAGPSGNYQLYYVNGGGLTAIAGGYGVHVALSSDGTYVYTLSADHTIRVYY